MKKRILSAALLAVLALMLLGGCDMHETGRQRWSDSARVSGGENVSQTDGWLIGGAEISGKISSLDIEWVSGSVNIEYVDSTCVSVSEAAARSISEDEALRFKLEGTRLMIRFSRSGLLNLMTLDKKLTVYLPKEAALEEVDISTVSADIECSALSAAEADMETVSGGIMLRDAQISGKASFDTTSGSIYAAFRGRTEQISADTVSGSIEIEAEEAGEIEADTTSGSVAFCLSTMPRSCEIDTISGTVVLRLPEAAGFELEFDTLSGSLSSTFAMACNGNKYLCGRGGTEIDVDTTSGNLKISKID